MTLKERIASKSTNQTLAYSYAGATWQESAIARCDKYSQAWYRIGDIVTRIHAGAISVSQAELEFGSLESKVS